MHSPVPVCPTAKSGTLKEKADKLFPCSKEASEILPAFQKRMSAKGKGTRIN
ncbi:MAG: hypothetical protein H7836_10105 [Magnetococcus sp. YQC-3]